MSPVGAGRDAEAHGRHLIAAAAIVTTLGLSFCLEKVDVSLTSSSYSKPNNTLSPKLNKLTARDAFALGSPAPATDHYFGTSDEISNTKKIFLDNGFPEHVVNARISNKMASMTVEPKIWTSRVSHKCTPTLERTNFLTVLESRRS